MATNCNSDPEMGETDYNSDEDDETLSAYITDILLHCARATSKDQAQQTEPETPAEDEPNDAVSDLLDDAIESVKRANINLYQLYTSEGGDERVLEGEFVAYDGDQSSSEDEVQSSESVHDLLEMRHFKIRLPELRRSLTDLFNTDETTSSGTQLDDLVRAEDWSASRSQPLAQSSCSDTVIATQTKKQRKTTESLPEIRSSRTTGGATKAAKVDNARSGESAGDSLEVEVANKAETVRDLKAQIASLVTSRKEERLDAFSKARSLFVDEIDQLRDHVKTLEKRTDFLRYDQERLMRQLWAQDMEHDQATSSMYQEIASLRKQVVTLMSDKIHLSRKFGKRLTQSLLKGKEEAAEAIDLLRNREHKIFDLKQLVLRQQKYIVDMERCFSDTEMRRYREYLVERSARREAALQDLIEGLYVDLQAATQKDEFTFRPYPCRVKGEQGDVSLISDVLNVDRHVQSGKDQAWHTDLVMAFSLKFEGYLDLHYPTMSLPKPDDLPYVRYQRARDEQRRRKGLPPRKLDPVELTSHFVRNLYDVTYLMSRDLCWPGIQELMAALE